MTLLVLGAGGHAQVVADAALSARPLPWSVEGYLDDDPARHGLDLPGGRVLGRIDGWSQFPDVGLVVGIGANSDRARVFATIETALAEARRFVVITHAAAVVAPGVSISHGTVSMAGVIINTGSSIGRNVVLNTACSVDHHCVIGDHVHVAPGGRLGGGVHVGEGALVGMGAVVLPGRRIGAWAVVGAGAVVTRDVEAGSVVRGNPAGQIGV